MKINSDIVSAALNLTDCVQFSADKISIDSRSTIPGDLFIAINRGHEFVVQALENGAVAAIICDPNYFIPNKTILVNNTTKALEDIGRYVKNLVSLQKVIGITGSVGKTTTRTWLKDILRHKFKTFSSIKNYNTIYGLTISFSLLEKDAEFGVFEMGSSSLGEISKLSKYLCPDVAILTNIYESHIGKFGTQENLAAEKISVIDGLNPGGKLVFDGDSLFKDQIQTAANQKNIESISVGFSDSCMFRIVSCDNYTVKLKTPLGIVEYELHVTGRHFSYISASIIAALYALGLDIHDFLGYFKSLSQLQGRGARTPYNFQGKSFEVIDDSYNASPSAVLASLDVLNSIINDKKIAILGQMKELGNYEEYYHNLIAEKLKSMQLYKVFFIGDTALWPVMSKVPNIACFEKLDNFVIEKVLQIVQNDSILFLKGSRSVELNKFIDYIRCSTI